MTPPSATTVRSHRQWRRPRRALIGIVAGVLVAGVAAACSGGQDNAGSNNGGSSSNSTITYAMPAAPANLDINPYDGDPTSQTMSAFDSTLLHYSTGKLPGNGCDQMATVDDVAPLLASSYKLSPDRLTITLTLSNTKSGYGNPLTAEDVVWSLQRALAVSSVASAALTQYADFNPKNIATAVSTHVVKLHLLKPSPIDVALLTHPLLSIFDATEAKKHATAKDPWATSWMQTHMAVFGPWKVTSFSPGDQVTLGQNPYYTGPRGSAKQVILKGVAEASSRAQLVSNGAATFAVNLDYTQFSSLKGHSGVTTAACKGPVMDSLILNTRVPQFGKLAVRQAISMAIDRQALNKGAYRGLATPATSGVSSAYGFVKPTGTYTYDLAKAKQMLAGAGYPNGFSFTLTYSATKGAQSPQSAILIQSMLQKIGITVKLNNVAAAAQYSAEYYAHQYQGILEEETPAIANPYYAAVVYSTSYSTQNTAGYDNKQYDSLVTQLRAAATQADQAKIASKLADLSVQTLPEIYLEEVPNLYAYQSGVSGFDAVPYDKFFPSQLTVK